MNRIASFLAAAALLLSAPAYAQKLHMETLGTGGPTVIFEAGLGGDTTAWKPVAEPIGHFAKVVLYDRSGFGKSAPDGKAITADKVTNDLHAQLAASAIRPPYILVGHSLGGLYMQRFAQKYPAEVSGLLLIDSSSADAANVPRRENTFEPGSAIYREREGMSVSRAQVAHGGPLPPVPLIVITAGQRDAAALERQRQLTALSPRSRFIVADGAGHDVQFDRPDIVIEAVRSLAVH